MEKTTTSTQIRRRKIGSGLMLFFLVGYFVTLITIQFSIGFMRGYGTGFGDGGRMPPEVVAKAGIAPQEHKGYDLEYVKAVVAETSESVKVPFWEDVIRFIGSFAALIGLIFFWHTIMSRVGTF